jgi:hypothetical protein
MSGGVATHILNLTPLVSFMLQLLNHKERAPDTHWIGGCACLRVDLDTVRRENTFLYQESNSDSKSSRIQSNNGNVVG